MEISAFTHYDDQIKKYCFRTFKVFYELPKVNEIFSVSDVRVVVTSVLPISIYPDQRSDDVFQYDFYYITFGYLYRLGHIYDYFSSYICVKKEGV